MTAPNKNEGLIARLEQVEHSYPGLPDVMRNPDGPEAARAIQDLEEEVGRLKEALMPFGVAFLTLSSRWEDHEDHWQGSLHQTIKVADLRLAAERLASTADG